MLTPSPSFQTDIVAVRTPQEGSHSFLSTRAPSPLDTSDSDCTKLGETPSPRRNQDSPRSRSPRPSSLPGVGENSSLAATPKRSLPRGSEVRVIYQQRVKRTTMGESISGQSIRIISFHPSDQTAILTEYYSGARNGTSPPVPSWSTCSEVICQWPC